MENFQSVLVVFTTPHFFVREKSFESHRVKQWYLMYSESSRKISVNLSSTSYPDSFFAIISVKGNKFLWVTRLRLVY